MNETVTIIDIVAQVTDETASGASSAEANVSKLEKSIMNLQKQIQGMKGKSKLEVAATLKDRASKGIQSVANAGKKIAGKVWEVAATLKDKASKGIQSVTNAGKKIAGKVWTVTLKAVDLVTAPFKKVLGLIANPIAGAAAFAGVSLGIADTVNTFKDFEQGMANVRAITGTVANEDLAGVIQAAKDMGIAFEEGSNATETSMNILTATAKHLGETTMFSAAQASEAMENLAMAGWKSKDIVAGMPGLLDLAAAGSVDLATAADVTSSALAQFKLEASESTRIADVLAATATNSKTDIAGLGESLKMAGTTAGALGFSIEDTALALGLMGNAGVDASSAGTSLRATLSRMSKQEGLTAEETNAMAEAMRKVGVTMTDSQGNSKSLMTIMRDLRSGFKGMTEAEKAATAANLAGMNAQSGLLAIVDASDEKFEELAAAISNAEGAASEMAKVKMDTLQGSLYYLQSAAEGVKIAIGEKLSPYARRLVDWVTARMPDIQNAVGGAVDFILGKIDNVTASIQSLTNSPEWQNAETLWDKVELAWDKLIAEPFDAWWSSTGKTWLADKANSVGEGLGTAIKTGILALLGIDVSGAAADGVDIGKSFFGGFMKGFEWDKVADALAAALKNGLKFLFKDAATLLPGGTEASGTSLLSAGALGYGAFKTYQTVKPVINGVKGAGRAIANISGITEGMNLVKAAKGSGDAAQSALAFAQNGALGKGVQFGTKLGTKLPGVAAKAGKLAAKAAPVLAGVASTIQMGVDAYHGTQKAEEWTGSNSTGSKVASGIGAAVGGLGGGILGNESLLRKTSNIGGGALKGAGIGAAVGSIFPVIGTAIGSAVGAGIGMAGAAIGGENIAKALSTAGTAIKGFFTETVPAKFGELVDGVDSFFSKTVPFAIGCAAGKIQGFFTGTVPQFFDNLVTGVTTFFAQTVPAATRTAGSAVSLFFTETVPNFFSGLIDGVIGFFTETVPSAITVVGKDVSTFFTKTVPEFFSSLLNGIVSFFTETVPQAITSVGKSIRGFFSNMGQKISGFFSGIWDSVTGNAGAGYQAAAAHAEGGIMTRPHVGLVAEDGAEAIIPLSGKRRERGLSLWEKTGEMLGVKPYADGAIVGNAEPAPMTEGNSGVENVANKEPKSAGGITEVPDKTQETDGGITGVPDGEPKPDDGNGVDKNPPPPPEGNPPPPVGNPSSASGGMTVPVTIENLIFEINISGGEIPDEQALVEVIREQVCGMTDEIAYRLAAALKQSFANTPKEQWG